MIYRQAEPFFPEPSRFPPPPLICAFLMSRVPSVLMISVLLRRRITRPIFISPRAGPRWILASPIRTRRPLESGMHPRPGPRRTLPHPLLLSCLPGSIVRHAGPRQQIRHRARIKPHKVVRRRRRKDAQEERDLPVQSRGLASPLLVQPPSGRALERRLTPSKLPRAVQLLVVLEGPFGRRGGADELRARREGLSGRRGAAAGGCGGWMLN